MSAIAVAKCYAAAIADINMGYGLSLEQRVRS